MKSRAKRLALKGLAVLGLALFSLGALSTKPSMPEFIDGTEWANSPGPLFKKDFEGKVVLVVFFSPGFAQSRLEVPILQYWQSKYLLSKFQVVGILAPVHEFEKNIPNSAKEIENMEITYPVAFDPELKLWRLYNVLNRPAHFLIDGRGRIRSRWEGPIDYKVENRAIRDLLLENGKIFQPLKKIKPPVHAVPQTEKITFGSLGLARFGNEIRPRSGLTQRFVPPAQRRPDFFYLEGKWKFEDRKLLPQNVPSRMEFETRTAKLWLTAGSPSETPLAVEVKLNGLPVDKTLKGGDLAYREGKSYLLVQEPRVYEILSAPEEIQGRFEFAVQDEGIEFYQMERVGLLKSAESAA